MTIKDFILIIDDMKEVRLFQGPLNAPKGGIRFKTLAEDTINVLTRHLENGKMSENLEFRVLGSHLYNVIFDSTINKKLKEAIREASKDEFIDFLRIILSFGKDASKLATLPWEYLYIPDYHRAKGKFIATEKDVVLCRSGPLNLKRLGPIDPPLKILYIVFQPQIMKDVISEPLEKVFKDLKMEHGTSLETKSLLNPEKRDIVCTLKKYHPHVIHFLCHGESGTAASVNKNKYDPLWLSDITIGYSLENEPPRLAFLQVCEGARSEDFRAFRGLALQLAYSGVPAVIAMQYKINVDIANMFAEKFYYNLFNGYPVEKAVQSARYELAMIADAKLSNGKRDEHFKSREFGCPVIYLQVPDALDLTKVLEKG